MMIGFIIKMYTLSYVLIIKYASFCRICPPYSIDCLFSGFHERVFPWVFEAPHLDQPIGRYRFWERTDRSNWML